MEYRTASLVTPAIALGLGAALMFVLQNTIGKIEPHAVVGPAAYVSQLEWAPLNQQPQATTPVLRITETQIAQRPAVQQRWVF